MVVSMADGVAQDGPRKPIKMVVVLFKMGLEN